MVFAGATLGLGGRLGGYSATLGSTIVYYSAVEVSMAHGLGTASLAVLVWSWHKTYGSLRPGRWLMVGILVGVTVLMRWQLATFALLPGRRDIPERTEEVRRGSGPGGTGAYWPSCRR